MSAQEAGFREVRDHNAELAYHRRANDQIRDDDDDDYIDRGLKFTEFSGRAVFAFPALLVMQGAVVQCQKNPAFFAKIGNLLLKTGAVGEGIIGTSKNLAASVVQMSAFSAIGMHLASNSIEYLLAGKVSPLISKAISVIACAGIFSLAGLIPSFTSGIALLLTAKLVGFVWNKIYEPFDTALQFGVGYGTAVAIQALPSAVGSLGPKLVVAINALNPLCVGAMFTLLAIIDKTAERVLYKCLGQGNADNQPFSPTRNLARITCSILATSAIATSIGLASSFAAAGTLLTISVASYTALKHMAFEYNSASRFHINGRIS